MPAGKGWRRELGDAARVELELEAENEELKAALGEAHVQLRVCQKGAEHLPPSVTSRAWLFEGTETGRTHPPATRSGLSVSHSSSSPAGHSTVHLRPQLPAPSSP